MAELTYEQASAGLAASPLKGNDLAMATASLKNHYALSANAGAGANGNPNAIVSSSDQVVTGEQNTKKTVTNLNKTLTPNVPGDGTSDAQGASDSYLTMLENQMNALETRRANDVGGINAQFNSAQTDLQGAQKSETGTESATLARIGGYLGPSASGTGAMLNLAATHKTEILKLQTARAAAIQAANNAIDDKEFAVAEKKAQEAKDLAATIYKRKQDFFDNTMKLQTQQETQIQNQLKDMAVLDPKTIPQETKDAIDSHYGVPGFADQYFAATSAATTAKTNADQLKAKTDMLDLLQKIPAGQKLDFPDGTSYVGMGSAGDVATFMQTDNNGVGHLITYNKRTGATNAVSVGSVGKTSSTGGGSGAGGVNGVAPTVVDNTTAVFQTNLEKNKDTNGKYDPDVYLGLRQELKNKTDYGPKLLRYYDNLFLNKANGFFSTDSITRLREKGVFYDAQSSAAATAPPAQVVDDTQTDNAP